MKDRLAAALAVVSLMGVPACGQAPALPGSAGEPGTSAPPARAPGTERPATPMGEPPQRDSPLLAPEERRVPLVVLPGDAVVEVDGAPVRRRDGLVDLTGKVGAVVHVRVRKRDKSTDDRAVTIKETGASPAVIDLNEPAAPGATTKADKKPKALPYGED